MGKAWSQYMKMNEVLENEKCHRRTCPRCSKKPRWDTKNVYYHDSILYDSSIGDN